jgi:hypothetical protein
MPTACATSTVHLTEAACAILYRGSLQRVEPELPDVAALRAFAGRHHADERLHGHTHQVIQLGWLHPLMHASKTMCSPHTM